MGCNTPIDDQQLRDAVQLHASASSATTRFNSTVGDAFVAEIDRQVREDKPIWENKAYLPRPALADTDGPFTKFRKLGVAVLRRGRRRRRHARLPAVGSYPAEDLGLSASQRYGSAPIA